MSNDKCYAVDIETIPNPEMVNKLPEPDIAIGNLKDPVKIELKKTQARQSQIDAMALSPLYGKVCCIGLSGEATGSCCLEEEAEILKWFFGSIFDQKNTSDTVITFNGIIFDIPFLYKRALILGVKVGKPMSYWCKRYSTVPHCDLLQVLSGWNSYKANSLESLAVAILGKNKIDLDYKEFPVLMETELGREKISEYCVCDCELTFELYKKCQHVLF